MTARASRPDTPTLLDNVVSRAEFRHQRYVLETSRSGWPWIVLAVILLAPGLITSIVLLGFAITGNDPADLFAAPNSPGYDFFDGLASLGSVSLITMNFALYLVVILITLGLSANSINREKVKRTWEVLLLTNVDARQLVWGKWWASMCALWGDHLMVAILRLGLVGLLVAQLGPDLPAGPFGISGPLTHTVLLSLFVLAFTALDASITVAMGLIAPLSPLPGTLTGAVVMGARMLGMVLNAIYAILVVLLVIFGEPYQYLLAVIVGLLFGVLLNYGMMRFAERVAISGQVSPPR